MQFEFFRQRYEFTALDSLFFPAGLAANILRGAFGSIFRSIAPDAAYTGLFEPGADAADWPRPFVFRARHLNGAAIQPNSPFYFDLNLFTPDPGVRAAFAHVFAQLAEQGIGPRRGRARLDRVVESPASIDLAPAASAPERIAVHFLSPTELKHEGKIVERPEFPILFARIRDRISTLSALYGTGPLDTRSAKVRMTRCELKRVESRRRSTRTGQTHSIGGFIGAAEYEGDLAEFLPWLEAARWTGVGRHCVWGNGEIEWKDPRR